MNLQGSVETNRFAILVLWVRKWFNLKYPETYCMLFVKDRKPFAKASDRRLPYLKSLAEMLESMDTYFVSSKTRILWLTTNIANALHSTLNRFITWIVFLLTKIKCVLAAEFQSDKTEGEFRINWPMSWGNYHISVQQALYRFIFKRLEVFNALNL